MKIISQKYVHLNDIDRLKHLAAKLKGLKNKYQRNEKYFESLTEDILEKTNIGPHEYHEAIKMLNIICADNDTILKELESIKTLMNDIKQRLNN